MRLLTVRYEPNEEHKMVPDSKAEQYVKDIVADTANENYIVLLTCQTIVVDYVRLMIARGEIGHDNVEFRFDNNVMYPDKYGGLDHWPKGFCDYTEDILSELIFGRHGG